MKKLENVQALRAVAALSVMVGHLGDLGPAFPTLPTKLGVVGVDVFFVLSGFIMVYVSRDRWGAAGAFLVQRAWRIYPLWWVCLVVEAPWILNYLTGKPDEYFGYVARSWLLLPTLSPRGDALPLLGQGWTLIYEIGFYAVFGLLMLFERRHLGVKLLAIFGASYAAGHALPIGSAERAFLTNPIYFEFAFGVTVAEAFHRTMLTWRQVVLAASIAAIAALTAWVTDANPHRAWRFLILGLPAAAALMLVLRLEVDGVRVPQAIVFIGEVSYSLYLTHTIVIHKAMPHVSGWSGLLTIAAACLAVAIAVHVIVERPLMWLFRSRRKSASGAPVCSAGPTTTR